MSHRIRVPLDTAKPLATESIVATRTRLRAKADAQLDFGPLPDDFEDASEVYSDAYDDAVIFTFLDDERTNTCTDAGGHVWLHGRCPHCEASDA